MIRHTVYSLDFDPSTTEDEREQARQAVPTTKGNVVAAGGHREGQRAHHDGEDLSAPERVRGGVAASASSWRSRGFAIRSRSSVPFS